ncbi:MAG: hypothetical protein U0W24_00245 [Bacteroidales bacterium]
MKVAGFTFIRNAVKYGYPVVEAIQSILPICDEVYVAVGNSEDDTLSLIKNIHPDKIKIIETVWDDALKEGGRVLAIETDKAFQAIPADYDWAFYIQGDEVIHEKYLTPVKEAMLKWKDNKNVDGLLFRYLHFYGSYDYIGSSEKWYPHEIRVVRNDKNIYSFRDAQGFRKKENKILRVKPVEAYIYHYGWVKEPKVQLTKRENFEKLYASSKVPETRKEVPDEFDYSGIDSLALFRDTHPAVMHDLIARKNWTFTHDLSKNKVTLKNRAKRIVKWLTGYEIGYKNYRII